MKGYKFIYANEIIASYMAGFETNKMIKVEFNKWGQFLEKTLSNEDYQVIAFYGKRYLDELKRDDNKFLFNIGESEIRLVDGKSKHDLDKHVFSYIEVDKLLGLLNAPEGYKKATKSKELTF